jgi:cytochrome c-type biogenesis protein CcmE
MECRPKFVGLVIVWTVRRLQDEHVTFTFTDQGRVTEVRAAGQLRDRAHTEVLGGY